MASKRTVLITGCSDGGLGAALALTFHQNGSWRVFASARNPAKLKEAEAAGIETVQLDVNSKDSIAKAVSQISSLTSGNGLDALVNNAGAGYNLPLVDVEMDKVRNLFELNVFSMLSVTQAFVPLLMQSAANSKRGYALLANHTSLAGLLGSTLPLQGAYNASKAAAASMTEALRLELGPFSIKVVDIFTGSVQSNFFDNTPSPKLPPNSMYNVAKETLEEVMSGEPFMKTAMSADKWAELVVKDLSASNPPHAIYRGTNAIMARLAQLLPMGWLDGSLKRMMGIDVLERKIREHGGVSEVVKNVS